MTTTLGGLGKGLRLVILPLLLRGQGRCIPVCCEERAGNTSER